VHNRYHGISEGIFSRDSPRENNISGGSVSNSSKFNLKRMCYLVVIS